MRDKRYQQNSYKKTNSIAGGILLILIALLSLISLFGGFAGVGNMIKGFLLGFFGLASYGYSAICLLCGVLLILQKKPTLSIKNTILMSLIFVFGLVVFQANTSSNLMSYNYGEYLAKCYSVNYTAGGLLYGILAYPLMKVMGELATIIVFSLFMVVCALILAAPLVNKDFTFSYSRQDRKTSYNPNATTRQPKKSKDKSQNVDIPKEPAFTILQDDEESEEVISEDSELIAYVKQDDKDLSDFEGGKKSRFKGLNRYYNETEDAEIDENIDIGSAINNESRGLYRKQEMRKDNSGLKNYEGTILNGIREVSNEEDASRMSKVDFNNMTAAEIIRYNNTEEGRRQIIDMQLANMNKNNPVDDTNKEDEKLVEDTPTPQIENDPEDNCYYIDQFGVRRRYYGLDLNKTLKENEKKLMEKQAKEREIALEKEKEEEERKKNDPRRKAILHANGVYNYQEDLNLAAKSRFNPKDDTSYRDAFASNNDEFNRDEVLNNPVEPVKSNTSSVEPVSSYNEPKVEQIVPNTTTKNYYPNPKPVDTTPIVEQPAEEKTIINTIADKVVAMEEEVIEPKVDNTRKLSDFSYDSVDKEAKDKLYEENGIAKPTGEKFAQFLQDDLDNSPSTIDVERKRRSDLGGTHNKKFMNEENMQFLKDALGKNDEPEVVEVQAPIKPEKYPYKPQFISRGNYKYTPPKVDLLKEFDTKYTNAEDYIEKGQIIEETLRGKGVESKIVGYTQGPAFSRYELEIDVTTNLSKLTNAKDNLSLALATNGDVEIEAPIRGKSLVGVEVPNDKVATVGLREAITSKAFYNPDAYLSIILGKDISGEMHVGDLKSMTHMLIAGATNSGKSVCVNAILTGILYKYSPEDVRLILVDPKMVELSVYNGLPHLLVPNALIDPEQVVSALKWLDREMERRLELFSKVGSRDLQSYNSRVTPDDKLPIIVLVIDEFADIMMQSQKIGSEMEELISRIARMARAVGIHMILATQRPSAEYITGAIKANIPTRIAFRTDSNLNSRIILDSTGAEKLLGRGDMLYMSKDPEPTRMQCPFLSDNEVSNITNYIREHNEPMFDERIIDDIVNNQIDKPQPKPDVVPTKIENKAKLDDNFVPVLKFLIEDDYNSPPSITKVQRQFEMGFPRTAGLFDKMTKLGFLVKDGRKYQLNITMDEFNKMCEELNQDE